MFKNISVRTFILVFILAVFLIADVICLILSKNIFLHLAVNIVWVVALGLLWLYMTKYLVTPINAVKRSIDEVNDGNLSVRIPIFGNNCAGRLIPGINNLSNNISTLVAEIRASSDSAMSLSAWKRLRQVPKTTPSIPGWPASGRAMRLSAPVKVAR